MQYYRFILAFLVTIASIAIPPQLAISQIVENPEFDNSTHWWWNHGDGDREVISDAYQSGNACLLTQRTQYWNGLAQSLMNDLEVGKDYHFSAYVKTVGVAEGELGFEIKQTDDRGDNYIHIGSTLANDTTWTNLQGGFKLESNGAITQLQLTVNGTWTDARTFDFIVDSVTITENDWEAAASARIELHRKRDFNLKLVNESGVPQANLSVDVEQIRHHFAFGSTPNIAFMTDPVYEDFFKQNFEWGTIEWDAQWKPVEEVRGIEDYTVADASIDFAEENGIQLKGHALAWPDPNFLPTWLAALSTTEVEAELEERITNVVSRYQSRLKHWDVCNETLNHSFFRDTLGDSIEPWMFQQARLHDADVKLFTNEFGIVDSQHKAQRYRDMILYHQANGADVGGIGLQAHFQESCVSPKSIEIGLGELTDLGPEIWFTEFDVVNPDPAERAKALETFYRYAFSVPEAQGIIMWGFWENAHWRGPTAALVDADWTINAAGQKYFDLIDEWTTTDTGASDASGDIGFRGFHGEYLITTTDPQTSVKNYHLVSVPAGANPLDVTLVIDAIPNSLTIYGTEGDDIFEYDLADTSKVTLNNQTVIFSLPPNTTTVRFAGLGGIDHLNLKTKNVNSQVRITNEQLTWINQGFKVRYSGIETADFEAQTLGSTATLIDSDGDDTFESSHEESTLVTPAITLKAKNFRYVYARANSGGNDTATLFDTTHIDRIHSDMNTVSVKWGARNRRAIGFEQTEVVSSVANDIAGFSLPNGTKTINVSPTETVVAFNGITHTFTNVYRTTLNGATGNTDTVLLTGSAGDETLKITPTISQFFGADFRFFFNGVPNFETAGADLGGTDNFVFRDTAGDDSLEIAGDTATISGSGFTHVVSFFDVIDAHSNQGGNDTALLTGPSGTVNLIGPWQ